MQRSITHFKLILCMVEDKGWRSVLLTLLKSISCIAFPYFEIPRAFSTFLTGLTEYSKGVGKIGCAKTEE